MRVLLVTALVLAISACAPTIALDKYTADIATANAEISKATAIIQSFSSNATVVAARLYTAEADCQTAMPPSTSLPTPTPLPENRSPLAMLSTPVPASPSEDQRSYFDSEYGFTISFPAHLEILINERTPSLYIGKQIHVAISDVNPLDCRGDCLLVESTSPATVADLDATKVVGYVGAIGGMIPQRYLRYILKHENQYYSFTLFALGRDAKNECCSTIWPLNESDIALFEQILGTLEFTN